MGNNLVHGAGLYKKGKYTARFNGKKTKHYNAWISMLNRCYSVKYQEKHQTYIGCTVCAEWLSFQSFAEWYEFEYPKDGNEYQLDKDLKILGNKIYSPETCLFVSRQVNTFTLDCGSARGAFMIGTHWHKGHKKFAALCQNPFTSKREHLGYFTNQLQAHMVWRKRKSELAYELAMIQDNQEVADALLQWKLALDNNLIHPY